MRRRVCGRNYARLASFCGKFLLKEKGGREKQFRTFEAKSLRLVGIKFANRNAGG